MQLRGFSYNSKKTYSYCIRKYLNFLSVKMLIPRRDSAKKYLVFLQTSGYDIDTVRINAECIDFFLTDVIGKGHLQIENFEEFEQDFLIKV